MTFSQDLLFLVIHMSYKEIENNLKPNRLFDKTKPNRLELYLLLHLKVNISN